MRPLKEFQIAFDGSDNYLEDVQNLVEKFTTNKNWVLKKYTHTYNCNKGYHNIKI